MPTNKKNHDEMRACVCCFCLCPGADRVVGPSQLADVKASMPIEYDIDDASLPIGLHSKCRLQIGRGIKCSINYDKLRENFSAKTGHGENCCCFICNAGKSNFNNLI